VIVGEIGYMIVFFLKHMLIGDFSLHSFSEPYFSSLFYFSSLCVVYISLFIASASGYVADLCLQ